MMPTISRMTLDLSREQGVRFANACGTRIDCRSGALWITVDNDPRDIVLASGEWFTLDSQDGTIVQAILGPAEVAVTQDAGGAARCQGEPRRAASFFESLRAALAWHAVPTP
jgi:hypothetical protein